MISEARISQLAQIVIAPLSRAEFAEITLQPSRIPSSGFPMFESRTLLYDRNSYEDSNIGWSHLVRTVTLSSQNRDTGGAASGN
jgi:hypothetical protein